MKNFQKRTGITRSVLLLTSIGLITGCAGGALPFAKKPSDRSVTTLEPIDLKQPQSGTVRFFGYVDVIRDREDDDQEFEARFGRFDHPVPVSVVIDAFSPPIPESCETSDKKKPIQIRDELAFPDHKYEFVDAGKSVTILYQGKRYASLDPRPDSDPANNREMITYETNVDSLQATFAGYKLFDARVRVDGLTVEIPGGGFPKFGSAAIPPVQEVGGFNLRPKDRVSAETQFKWRPADNPNALVEVNAGGGGLSVFCAATDDGEFTFPPAIKEWIGDRTIPHPEIFREAIVMYRDGDAILIVSQSTDL